MNRKRGRVHLLFSEFFVLFGGSKKPKNHGFFPVFMGFFKFHATFAKKVAK